MEVVIDEGGEWMAWNGGVRDGELGGSILLGFVRISC
jgi:hypothetical protein